MKRGGGNNNISPLALFILKLKTNFHVIIVNARNRNTAANLRICSPAINFRFWPFESGAAKKEKDTIKIAHSLILFVRY